MHLAQIRLASDRPRPGKPDPSAPEYRQRKGSPKRAWICVAETLRCARVVFHFGWETLFSIFTLDLFPGMDNMDIDQVVDIPDTPDRVSAQHINGVQFRKDRNSAVPGHSTTSDFSREGLHEPKSRNRPISENARLRGLSLKSIEYEPRDSSTNSSLQKPGSSQNFPLFRRASAVHNSKLECRPPTRMQLDKGKAKCNKASSKLPAPIDEDALFDMAFPLGGSKAPCAEGSKDVQGSSLKGSSLHSSPVKGKGKLDFISCNGFGPAMNDGKGTGSTCDSQLRIGKQNCRYSPISSPRVTGHKRLVRNGCISPHNIVSRAQKVAEIQNVDCSSNREGPSSNMGANAQSEVPIQSIIAEENSDKIYCHKAKGKGAMIYPTTSKMHDSEPTHQFTRTGTSHTSSEATNDRRRDLLLDGWRSTRNHCKTIRHAGDDDDVEVLVDKSKEERRNVRSLSVSKSARGSDDRCEAPTASRLQISQPQPVLNINSKRQKKHGSTSRTENQGSGAFSEDSEIMFLGSSTGRSSRTLNAQRPGTLEPIYEIDEPTPVRRNDESHGLRPSNDEDEETRARQVEADEILARELQEQMYNESPIFGGSEVDGNIAWLVQQFDDDDDDDDYNDEVFPAAFVRDNSLSRAGNSAFRTNRQPQVSRNRSIRRGSQARVPATVTAQWRSHLRNRAPARMIRSRNHYHTGVSTMRNFQFPSGMDLDTRLDILGELEDAVGEFGDLSMTATNIHRVQRDFNENDYEMLLALDDNIREHGLSASRINSLPESVVQTENFDDCAICLETPALGETIRHLPCLHKFHKECIDPWLSRKTSCPVCKSSVT